MNGPEGSGPVSQPPVAQSVTSLPGVGERMAERLQRLGIKSVFHLLFHLPLRYEDRTRLRTIAELRVGESALFEGEVRHQEIKVGRRRSLIVYLSQGHSEIVLRFFYFRRWHQEVFAAGQVVRCFGEVKYGPLGREVVHPERIEDGLEEAQCYAAVYPLTEGITQTRLRQLVASAFEFAGLDHAGRWKEGVDNALADLIPAALLPSGYPDFIHALLWTHYPPIRADLERLNAWRHPAQQRLLIEELVAHQLCLREAKTRQTQLSAPRIEGRGRLAKALVETLPFSLTAAQTRVVAEVRADLNRAFPMRRLVQGDVGCGKTLIAALVICDAVEAGWQVSLMAPTELLAQQHSETLRRWLIPLGVGVACLTGTVAAKARRQLQQQIADGEVDVVVGTHALYQQGVQYARLGLVINDEQHRFGVDQRMALLAKGSSQNAVAHQLMMTATPIPRTLAMVTYADMDISVVDELPPGRTPVETVALPQSRRDQVLARLYDACQQGRQGYWVCAAIEENEESQCQAAEETYEMIKIALPDLKLGLVHGRLSPAEKGEVMAVFQSGELDLLVATTVIEVGVDVPNASLMVIDNAERFGLAQLHQLRGRVGRGAVKSSCVLLYRGPLSDAGRARLAVLRETNDGFVVAQKDLEIRGPGEFLGRQQSGVMRFGIVDLVRDQEMLPLVAEVTAGIETSHQGCIAPLIQRWMSERARYFEA